MTAVPDFFGILDAVKRLTPPAGMETAHLDGFSWARNGASYGASTKLTADDWNRILANLRAVLIGSGVDLSTLDPGSPSLLRDVMVAYIAARIVDEFPGLFLANQEDFAAVLGANPAFVAAVVAGLPLAFVAKAGDTMSGALLLAADPAAPLGAATKQYVDNVAAGLDIKPSVRAATIANIALTGAQTIDGVGVVAGNRVLVKNQTTASQNGIYVAAAGAWARALDLDVWGEVPGANVWVEEGTVNGDTAWVSTANAGGTIGTTAMPWTQFGGTGAFQAASAVLSALAGIGASVAGDLLYAATAGTWARLAKGTASQALVMNSGATAPQWATLPFTRAFESSQQTMTNGGALTLAHGLGVSPKLYMAVMQCIVASSNYAVGDEVLINPGVHTEAAANGGISIVPDATNIVIRIGSSGFRINDKSTGGIVGVSFSNWRLVVRAWA